MLAFLANFLPNAHKARFLTGFFLSIFYATFDDKISVHFLSECRSTGINH
jgi:hypothetical protein